MKKFQGHLGISRPQGGNSEGKICITITDAHNHCSFLVAEIGYAEFAQALTGMGGMPCDVETWPDAPIGKRLETKAILVPRLDVSNWAERKERAREALVPYETDGWRGCDDDMLNSHRWVRNADGDWSRVTFRRYVDP